MNENQGFHILIVDDEPEYQNVFRFILEAKGFAVSACSSGEQAIALIQKENIQIVLTDLKMPGISGTDLVRAVKQYDPAIEIIVVTAFGSIQSAVEAMKEGAFSYFIKSSSPEELLADLHKITTIKQLEHDNQILKQQTHSPHLFLDTKNLEFKQILTDCRRIADSQINVLILGESGVGKEVIAQYIHRLSSRSAHHFIAVNCQVFSEGTIESELFGHEKGSFTGASAKRIGRFEEANFGTLFLDEIGELPNHTQVKLLRVLETRSIERIGSNRVIPLDLRLICATNRSLPEEVSRGNFRKDLFYRINTVTVTVPPLRSRREDLPSLISHFLPLIQHDLKKKIEHVDDQVWEFLMNYDYPGNVREMKNILERLVALSENGQIQTDLIQKGFPVSSRRKNDKDEKSFAEKSLHQVRAEAESAYIRTLLEEKSFDLDQASLVLGITRRQLQNKLDEYDLKDFMRRGRTAVHRK